MKMTGDPYYENRIAELEKKLEALEATNRRMREDMDSLLVKREALEAELKSWRDAFPDCSCPDNCLQHN